MRALRSSVLRLRIDAFMRVWLQPISIKGWQQGCDSIQINYELINKSNSLRSHSCPLSSIFQHLFLLYFFSFLWLVLRHQTLISVNAGNLQLIIKMGLVQKGLQCRVAPQDIFPDASTKATTDCLSSLQIAVFESFRVQSIANKCFPPKALPLFKTELNPFKESCNFSPSSAPQQCYIRIWDDIIPEDALFSIMDSFLNFDDLMALRKVNRKLSKHCARRILKNENNWLKTIEKLKHNMTQIFDLEPDEPSQHSLDLDRSLEYFSESEAVPEQQVKLNRVLTALSFQIQYFQGIMPMCAALLNVFDQYTSFLVLRLIMGKCKHIQNRPQLYLSFMENLNREIEVQLPEIYTHLSINELQIDYFAMKWVMGLFSEDMSPQMLLRFWDMLCHSDLSMVIYVIVSILKNLSSQIVESSGDQLNELLKRDLKEKLSNSRSKVILEEAKQIYLRRRFID